ncbi:MAG: 16S rRNA (cytosine(1402)-N(4))-methyltransferase RsmH [Pseudomonadota bacterium]
MPASLKTFCDLTVGEGGHAKHILEASSPGGRLVGIDRDVKALDIARARLSEFSSQRFELIHAGFSSVKSEMENRRFPGFDGILADFGISSFQLDNPERGFSFMSEGPLDMRMDPSQPISAYDVVNNSDVATLAGLMWEYGNERFSRKIARAIRDAARRKPIESTQELAGIIRRSIGRPKSGRVDSATRTFLAVRVKVNDELNEISRLMDDVFSLLNPGGVFVCLSYHSLEERIVKRAMVDARRKSLVKILTKKPLGPSRDEIRDNPRARSAKLRAAMKLEGAHG